MSVGVVLMLLVGVPLVLGIVGSVIAAIAGVIAEVFRRR